MTSDQQEMNWATHAMGAATGGLAALFAVGVAPPVTQREALIRVGFGIFVIFATTGWALEKIGTPPTVNNVLMYALVIGSVGWFLFSAAVNLAARSPLKVLQLMAAKVIGPAASALTEEPPVHTTTVTKIREARDNKEVGK